MYKKQAHLHFVGIGGIGMSGIAKILRMQGYTISGCDTDLDKQSVKELAELGCTIHHGNNTPQCADTAISILVYSSAISKNNPEIIEAQKRGIPTIPRALMLAELMRTKFSVAIAGSHGKTTTTSLVSHLLIEAKKDPTVIIGGHLKTMSTNAHFGSGDFLVAEADESDRSLIHLHASIAVLTNISLEHLDTYKDMNDIKATFRHFLDNLPFYGTAIVCSDDENVRSLLPLIHTKTIHYGLDKSYADIWAEDIEVHADYSTFSVHTKQKKLGTIKLTMPGIHNILNSLAAIAASLEFELSFEEIKKACNTFKGVDRRFSFKKRHNDIDFFDDYGHHPKEIKHSLLVAKKKVRNQLTVVFQPHRYTRTDKLWQEFVDMFLHSPIDHLIITDIYAASEPAIAQISGQNLAKAIEQCRPAFKVHYAPYEEDFSSIRQKINEVGQSDDLVLLQGAGRLNLLVDFLP